VKENDKVVVEDDMAKSSGPNGDLRSIAYLLIWTEGQRSQTDAASDFLAADYDSGSRIHAICLYHYSGRVPTIT